MPPGGQPGSLPPGDFNMDLGSMGTINLNMLSQLPLPGLPGMEGPEGLLPPMDANQMMSLLSGAAQNCCLHRKG